MSLLDNVLLAIDPHTKEPLTPIEVGEKVEAFQLELSSGNCVEIEQLLKNGPVLLHFIRGTWCPVCRAHMRKVSAWMDAVKSNVTNIFVSDEGKNKINDWKKKEGFAHLFASDPNQVVINMFGLEFSRDECTRPATFLIDKDRTIRLAHYSKRNRKMYDKLSDEIESSSEEAAKEAG